MQMNREGEKQLRASARQGKGVQKTSSQEK